MTLINDFYRLSAIFQVRLNEESLLLDSEAAALSDSDDDNILL